MVKIDSNPSQIMGQFRAGELDRRAAIKQLMLCGLSAPAAYAMLGEMETLEAHAQGATFNTNPEEISNQFDQLRKILSSRQVISALQQMDNAQTDDQKRQIANTLIQTLSERDYFDQLKIPYNPEVRVALRVFEPAKTPTASERILEQKISPNFSAAGRGTLCGSLGYILCVSYGKQL